MQVRLPDTPRIIVASRCSPVASPVCSFTALLVNSLPLFLSKCHSIYGVAVPCPGRNPKNEFREERIPGARFFDVDAIADTASNLPHMLPSAEAFAVAADALGIGNDSQVRRCASQREGPKAVHIPHAT